MKSFQLFWAEIRSHKVKMSVHGLYGTFNSIMERKEDKDVCWELI